MPAPPTDTRTLDDLRKENDYLRASGGVSKKVGCLGSGQTASSAEKAQAITELRPAYALAALLEAAGLSRSTFYYQAKAQHVGDRYASLKASIRAIYEQHKGRYGYRRITAALRNDGAPVNHKAVQRLMQVLGLKCLVRPKKYRSYRRNIDASVPNVLQRQFQADKPNLKWVTDVTQV